MTARTKNSASIARILFERAELLMTEADMAMKFGQPELGLNMLMVADAINQRLESAIFASRSGLRDLNVDMVIKQADHVVDSMVKCQNMLD